MGQAWLGCLPPSQHAHPMPGSLRGGGGGLLGPCVAGCFCAWCSRAARSFCGPWGARRLGPGPFTTMLLGGSWSLWPSLRATIREGALAASTQVLDPFVQVIAFCLQRPAQLLQPLNFYLQAFQLLVPECFLGGEMGPLVPCHQTSMQQCLLVENIHT